MPQTLHDAIQKALIAEEELISGGQTKTPARPAGQVSSGTQQHQTPARHMSGYRGFQRGSTFTTPWRPSPQQSVDTLSGTTASIAASPAASNSLGLFSRTDQGSRLVGRHLLLRVPGLLGRRRGVGRVGSHTTSATVLWRGPEHLDQPGPTTVGDMGKAHRIHAVVNNRQEEHQSTMLEMIGTVADQTLSILIDLGATESFISGAVLKRIKVKAVEQDEFSFVEMALGAKQKVGGKVTGCALNLGEFVTRPTCMSRS
jgi:hypothetical protein